MRYGILEIDEFSRLFRGTYDVIHRLHMTQSVIKFVSF